MRIVNENYETITEYDLSKGQLINATVIKETAIPIDNINKFAWDDSDYEEVRMYLPFTEESQEPTQEERLKALESAMLAMMTGGISNV